MRSVLAVCFVIAIYLGIQGAKGDIPEIHFSLIGATNESYTNFITALRTHVATGGTESINGISILNGDVQGSERFIRVVLTNYQEESITVGIDVVNVYVLGYFVGERSYVLRQDDESVPLRLLFPDATRENLSYTGSYIDLERAARPQTRETIPLGLMPLNTAITNLFYNNEGSIPRSLLVIIQMVSEAARFNYIVREIGRAIVQNRDYTPGPPVLSLENNWGALSRQIQQANLDSGAFDRSVTLQNREGRQFNVDNIRNPTIAAIALLLSAQCVPRNTGGISNTFVAQPAVDVVLVEDNNSPETCPVRSPTHISGRDGLCVDVRDGQYNNGNPIQLWPCGPKSRQQWTFHKDRTIRSMEKCMATASGTKPGNYVFIYDCSPAEPQFKWVLSDDGSITNPQSGLVLTAPKATKGTTLLVETNVHAARQGWRAGDDVDPLVSFIVGYADLCMQANNANTEVSMGKCVFGKQQQWALYNDGTIRVNSVRNRCLTSDGHSFLALIFIEECKGWGNQRWVFKTNGYIQNPNDKLVMQVKDIDVSLSQIILQQPTDLPTQKWLPMF